MTSPHRVIEPTVYQQLIYLALRGKPDGSVYYGTAPTPRRFVLRARKIRRRQRQLAAVAARSQFAQRSAA